MSHFTVLIAAKAANPGEALLNLESILEPYDENKEMTPYVRPVNPDNAIEFYKNHPDLCGAGGDGPAAPFDEFVKDGDLEAWHEWNRQAVGCYNAGGREDGIYDPESDSYGYLTTYNPDSQWDWWVLGGRWRNKLKVRAGVSVVGEQSARVIDPDVAIGALPHWAETMGGETPAKRPGYADLARKALLDIDGLRNEAALQAVEMWQKYEEVTKDLVPCKPFNAMRIDAYAEAGIDPEGYEQFIAGHQEGDLEMWRKEFRKPMDVARERFHNDPWVQALRKAELLGFMSSPHEMFFIGHDEPQKLFVEEARASALSAYAFIDVDGQWYQRGKMGWFGMSNDEKDATDWGKALGILVDRLDDDVYIAMVDCHI